MLDIKKIDKNTIKMDYNVKHNNSQDSLPSNTSETFQKFVYELFEKNGVISDLRAHLRSHIIKILKTAENGKLPAPQNRSFTKHLEPRNQALSLLVAEHLLRMECNYSLSVFISEIPLASMNNTFSNLLKNSSENGVWSKLEDADIVSILSSLGISCDSSCHIMKEYHNSDSSLLNCVMQAVPFRPDQDLPHGQDSHSSSSIKSSDHEIRIISDKSRSRSVCNHSSMCAFCNLKMKRLEEKFVEAKRQNKKLFTEIRTEYDSELQTLKLDGNKRVHNSMISHALALKKRLNELEENYRLKEEQLSTEVHSKKELLRALLDSIQAQHRQLAGALSALADESRRLNDKEEQIKKEIIEAENFIKQRSKEMSNQLKNELDLLLSHLHTLKEERQNIASEKLELESLKKYCYKDNNNTASQIRINSEDNRIELNDLKTKLHTLKTYLSTVSSTKQTIDGSTITELCDVTAKLHGYLNNEDACEGRSTSKITPNLCFNEFRKEKNINFEQSDKEDARRDFESNNVTALREENTQLRHIASQQRARIETLNGEVRAAQAQITTASSNHRPIASLEPFSSTIQRLSSVATHTRVSGGGEEVSVFPARTAFTPSDPVPFICEQPRCSHSSRPPASFWGSGAPRSTQRPVRATISHERVLRDAKRSLRYLEIEADAVHNAYLEYKQRHADRATSIEPTLEPTLDKSDTKIQNPLLSKPAKHDITRDLNQMAASSTYHQKGSEPTTHPIPSADYRKVPQPSYLLQTPMTEFRKLYKPTYSKSYKGPKINDGKPLCICTSDENLPSSNVPSTNKERVSPKSNDESNEKDNRRTSGTTTVYNVNVCNKYKPTRDLSIHEKPCLLTLEVENLNQRVYQDKDSNNPIVLEIQSSLNTQELVIPSSRPNSAENNQNSASIFISRDSVVLEQERHEVSSDSDSDDNGPYFNNAPEKPILQTINEEKYLSGNVLDGMSDASSSGDKCDPDDTCNLASGDSPLSVHKTETEEDF